MGVVIEMFGLLEEAMEFMQENLNEENKDVNIQAAENAANAINDMRNRLKKKHLKSIEKGEYKFESGMIYTDLFSAVESAGDHVLSISEAASGKIG